jgi:hypothetical protein
MAKGDSSLSIDPAQGAVKQFHTRDTRGLSLREYLASLEREEAKVPARRRLCLFALQASHYGIISFWPTAIRSGFEILLAA